MEESVIFVKIYDNFCHFWFLTVAKEATGMQSGWHVHFFFVCVCSCWTFVWVCSISRRESGMKVKLDMEVRHIDKECCTAVSLYH